MKFKLDKSVPSDVKFGTTHLTVEFDDVTEFDHAQRLIDGWFEQELGKLSPEVLAIMKDHSPRKFGGGGGGQKKAPPEMPKDGEYAHLVTLIAGLSGHQPTQEFHNMMWGYAGTYTHKGTGKEKGPFQNGYMAAVKDANEKGWVDLPGKWIEKLRYLVQQLESGTPVTVHWCSGNSGKPPWESYFTDTLLSPVTQASTPQQPQFPPQESFQSPFDSAPPPGTPF